MKSVHAVISGRVQGVWFRAWTAGEATALGLTGWVRNRTDGTVEAVFSGDADDIDRMLTACRDGPPLARVEHVEVQDCAPPEPDGFVTRPTE